MLWVFALSIWCYFLRIKTWEGGQAGRGDKEIYTGSVKFEFHILYLMEKLNRQQFPNWLVHFQPGSLHCILDLLVQVICLKNKSGDVASPEVKDLPQILPMTIAQ